MQNLVIVESPTKARTLSKFLGEKYQVEASYGHVRDLPKSKLGIDTEKNFTPQYIIPKAKTKRVNELKKIAQNAKTLWLATDPDREGEAIAWHITELLRNSEFKIKNLKLKIEDIKRVVFHEITPEAIQEAFVHPRDLDLRLVDAQQARRILDRLVGYKLSPLLWKKIKSGLSAGRVQSVALRLVVDREKEIEAFKPEEYWVIEAELTHSVILSVSEGSQEILLRQLAEKNDNQKNDSFTASLIELNGKKLAIKNKEEADGHVSFLKKAEYQVTKVTKKEIKKSPFPPFTTSTLQQTASSRLGLSAKKTMALSQALYEHGLITYMRTDSVNLAPSALTSARSFIEQNIGKAYLPQSPRVYKTKSKLAQEAHEAIRPTNIRLQSSDIRNQSGMTRDHIRLYDLIWKRMLATQMSEAMVDQTTVDVTASSRHPELVSGSIKIDSDFRQNDNASYLLKATGSIVKFKGWLKIYEGKTSDEKQEDEKILPKLSEGEILKLLKLLPNQHFTEPPSRYNEASLIKKLEELGIGRPSTYAPILSTIQERFYVEKKERRFFPTPLGFAVTDFLVKFFPDIVNYIFTASLEDELDEIAQGKREWQSTIKTFYDPFEKKLEDVEEKAAKVKIKAEVIEKKCPECGKNLQIKFGKFGKFLACLGFPDCKYTESFAEKLDISCPSCGGDIILRRSKKGKPFYGCKNWPNCKFASWTKPKRKRGTVR